VTWELITPLKVSLTLIFLVIVPWAASKKIACQTSAEGQQLSPLNPVQRPTEELLVLEMRLGRYILSEGIIGYIHRGGVLLSLEELARVLEFPINVEPKSGQAAGWFLNENRLFSLDIARREVVVEGRTHSFDPDLVELHSDGIYVDATLFKQWFPVDIEVDLPRLVINVTSHERLPIEQRLEREKIQDRLSRGSLIRPIYPRAKSPYSLLDWPFIDVSSNFLYRSPETGGREARYNGLFSGDFLYMSSVLFLAGIDDDSLTDVRLTMGRSDPDGNLLGPLHAQSFKLGDIFSPQIPLISNSNAGRGAEISNFPLNRPSEFDRTTLQGELPPDWEVELYRNEVLLDFQKSRADGRYEFIDVPLLYGVNVLRLIFYGPQGQKREEVRSVYVGPGLVHPGKGHFRITANQQDKYLFLSKKYALKNELFGKGRFFAEYEEGISRRFSISYNAVTLPFEDGRRYYASLGLRAAILGAFTRLDVSQELEGGSAFQFATQFNMLGNDVFAEHGQFFDFVSERIRKESDPIESLTRIRLDGVLSFWRLPRVPFSLVGFLERRESGRYRTDILNRLSIYLLGVSFSNTLSGSLSHGGGSETVTRADGLVLVSGHLKGLTLRAQSSYELPPHPRFKSVSFTGDYKIPRNFSARFTVNRELLDNHQTNYSVGLNRNFEAFLIGLEGMYENKENYSVRLSISFSVGQLPHSQGLLLRSSRMGNTGAASVRVFLDENQNGRFDADDKPLQDVRLRYGGRVAKETDKNGVTFIPALSSYRPIDITIDVGSLQDPYWIPISEGVTVTPRPGKTVLLEFPVIATGEIDGMVYLYRDTSASGVSNVELQLVNSNGEVVQQVKSAFDGFYLFTKVPPGRYVVRVSPDQIKRLNLKEPLDHEVVIEGNGTVVGGVDFTLRY